MEDTNQTACVPLSGSPAVFRPSEYTAALIQALRSRAAWARGADVLEIGSGSGVVLAALGELGAASLCGVDIECAAARASDALLRALEYGARARVYHGDMWQKVAGRRFDLIAANLPQFPITCGHIAGRLASWSAAGPTGRERIDPFLQGLPEYLAPGGRAVITHNGFVDLARSRRIVEQSGLAFRIATTVLVYIAPEKFGLMAETVRRAELGRSLYCYGAYTFGEMHVVEIGSQESLG
jgi:release factor glutamine methyltransferase